MWCSQWLSKRMSRRNHFVVAFDLVEGLFQNLNRVLGVAREKLLERARHAGRRLDQAVTLGIFSGPSDDRSHRRLDFGAARLLDFALRRSCAIQHMHIWTHRLPFHGRVETTLGSHVEAR
jgi:hypothetical protein